MPKPSPQSGSTAGAGQNGESHDAPSSTTAENPTNQNEAPNQGALEAVYVPVQSPAAAQSEDADITYHRILLPIDSSRRAECSLVSGIGIVEGEEKLCGKASKELADVDAETNEIKPDAPEPVSRLLLAAVIKPPELPIPAPYPEEIQQLNDQIMKISRESVISYLDELKARVPVNSEKLVIENESISAAIHDLVEKENVDLVILCAHGMTGHGLWPYGSIARNYIEYGNQTALVIQDVPRAQVRQTPAEIAAEKYGSR